MFGIDLFSVNLDILSNSPSIHITIQNGEKKTKKNNSTRGGYSCNVCIYVYLSQHDGGLSSYPGKCREKK